MEAALKDVNYAIELHGNDAVAFCNRGVIYEKMKDSERALTPLLVQIFKSQDAFGDDASAASSALKAASHQQHRFRFQVISVLFKLWWKDDHFSLACQIFQSQESHDLAALRLNCLDCLDPPAKSHVAAVLGLDFAQQTGPEERKPVLNVFQW